MNSDEQYKQELMDLFQKNQDKDNFKHFALSLIATLHQDPTHSAHLPPVSTSSSSSVYAGPPVSSEWSMNQENPQLHQQQDTQVEPRRKRIKRKRNLTEFDPLIHRRCDICGIHTLKCNFSRHVRNNHPKPKPPMVHFDGTQQQPQRQQEISCSSSSSASQFNPSHHHGGVVMYSSSTSSSHPVLSSSSASSPSKLDSVSTSSADLTTPKKSLLASLVEPNDPLKNSYKRITISFIPFTTDMRKECGKKSDAARACYKRPVFMTDILKEGLVKYFKGSAQMKGKAEATQYATSCGRYLHFVQEIAFFEDGSNKKEVQAIFDEHPTGIPIETTQQHFWNFVKKQFNNEMLLISYLDELKDVGDFSAPSILNEADRIQGILNFIRINSSADPFYIGKLEKTIIFMRQVVKTLRISKKKHQKTLDIDYYKNINSWCSLREMLQITERLWNFIMEILTNNNNEKIALESSKREAPPEEQGEGEEDEQKIEVVSASSGGGSSFRPKFSIEYVKGYILSTWILQNRAVRSQNFDFLTVGDVLKAFKQGEGSGKYVVDFKTFKTSATYGYQSLSIDEKTKQLILLWISIFNLRDEQILFPHSSKAVSHFWRKETKLLINITRIRAIVQTESIEHLSLEEQQQLARGQCHSSAVANAHYTKLLSRDVQSRADKAYEKLKRTILEEEITEDFISS